jgi:hypothetical protein
MRTRALEVVRAVLSAAAAYVLGTDKPPLRRSFQGAGLRLRRAGRRAAPR